MKWLRKYIPVIILGIFGLAALGGEIVLAYGPTTEIAKLVADNLGQVVLAAAIAIAALVRGIGGSEDAGEGE